MSQTLNSKPQSFVQKTKRFLFPVISNKKDTFKISVYFAIEWFFGVILIFFIKDITSVLETWTLWEFYVLLWEYGLYFALCFVMLFFTYTWWTYTYNRYKSSIEKKYLPQYVRLDMWYHEKIGTWKSIAIISKGVKTWAGLIDRSFIEFVNVVLSVGLTTYLLMQVDYTLVILMFFLLWISLYIGLLLNKKVLKARRKRIELDNVWSKNMVRIIMAKNEILQSKQISNEVSKLKKLHEWQIFYNEKMAVFMVPFFALWIIVVLILLYLIFLFFWKAYYNGDIWLWIIVWLTGAIIMMQKVFMNLLDFIKNFSKEFAEVQVLWDFFDTAPLIEWYESGTDFKHKKWVIELKNIHYAYDEKNNIFEDFSLKIKWEKVTALVGPSWWGKTTLVKLVSAYVRQDEGKIIVDGQDLKGVSLKTYYNDIGYLTQEPAVFDGSVRENLLYATWDNISDDKIWKIVSLAHCEFIYDFPEGIDTEIWERWIRLSWWQKQRLAIAKIFLKDPKIIILDEPTSALDSLSEKKITSAMHNLFKNRTVIVIAHRLQTVKHADDIIVIQSGKIIERGTHEVLVKNKWFYKEMLDLQSGF